MLLYLTIFYSDSETIQALILKMARLRAEVFLGGCTQENIFYEWAAAHKTSKAPDRSYPGHI